MKKLFLIPLMTLFCSVSVWATDVATWDELMAAVATPNASVTLTANIDLPGGTHDFNGATITCGEYSLQGATLGATYILQNATFNGMTKKSTPAILFTAGDSISLKNITTVTTSGSNLSAITLSRGRTTSPNIALGVNIDANCNLTGNTAGSARGAGISCGWYSAKIYNYGTINGVSINVACTFTNHGTINEIYNAGNKTITADPTNSGANNTLNIPSNAFYITSGGPTVNNYGTINGIVYTASSIINNYSTGTMDGGVYLAYGKNATINNYGTFSQECSSWGKFILANEGTASIQNGTFDAVKPAETSAYKNWGIHFSGSKNINIYVGTGTHFKQLPTGSNAIIHPNCIFDQDPTSNFTIEDGYMWRESDGMIVEMPHNVAEITHANSDVEYSTDLYDALTTAADGDIIKMIDDATLNYTARLNVNPAVAAKHITLDINGHEFRAITSVKPTLELYGGSLNIINSVPGVGGIYNDAPKDAIAINVYGTVLKNCNPKTAAIENLYTYLNIAEGVNIYAINSGSSAIVVNHATEYSENDVVINKGTEIYENYVSTGSGSHAGVANGVRVDVHGSLYAQKYAFKVNGTVAYPDATKVSAKTGQTYGEYFESMKEHFYGSGTTETINVGDTAYSPFIHIYPSAILDADNDDEGAAGIYASGYARWIIEGTSKGSSGLYVRSGKVAIKNDAKIQSSFEGSASFTPGSKSGIKTKGNAIVVNTNNSYPGHIEFIIEGDARVSTGATGGAALFEYVQVPALLESLVIKGGQFTGPYALAISDEAKYSGNVFIYGTTLTDDNGVGTASDIIPLLASGSHTTVVPNDNGTTTVIVSAGTPPAVITDFGSSDNPQEGEVVNLDDKTDANWTGTDPGYIKQGDTIVLGELQIISGTAGNEQVLTVENNAVLNVERLIMNEHANIIVAAGGTLIIEGDQGINAPAAGNIQLSTSETAQASFLFSPDVQTNRHPSATVKMMAQQIGKNADGDYYWHRFAMPVEHINTWTKDGDLSGTTYPTYLYGWDYVNNDWLKLPNGVSDMVPLQGYTLTLASDEIGSGITDLQNVTYTFEGNLVGNANQPLNFQREGFNFFGNSYTGYMDVLTLIQGFTSGDVEGTVYMWCNDPTDENNRYQSYEGVSLYKLQNESQRARLASWQKEVAPMQTFILRLRGANSADEEVDYASAIWGNPRYGNSTPSAAPKRVATVNDEEAYFEISVKAVNGKGSRIDFTQDANHNDAFESGYDVVKFMNERTVNLYATINGEDFSSVVTDALNGKLLSLQTNDEFDYTMSFKNVEGEQYAVLDHATNQITLIAEGITYPFVAQPNSTIDGRFEIISVNRMPTDVETVENAPVVRGIYTITGQYVGENFETLPKGVYVIDGVKIVK